MRREKTVGEVTFYSNKFIKWKGKKFDKFLGYVFKNIAVFLTCRIHIVI